MSNFNFSAPSEVFDTPTDAMDFALVRSQRLNCPLYIYQYKGKFIIHTEDIRLNLADDRPVYIGIAWPEGRSEWVQL